MSVRALLVGCGLIFVSGCLYHAKEHTDETVSELVGHPYDAAPPETVSAAQPRAPGASADKRADNQVAPQSDVQTTAYMAEAYAADQVSPEKPKMEPKVPPEVPGAEAPAFHLPEQQSDRQRAIIALFPPLPPLPSDPTALPGPEGRPYTLSQLQQLAAANSPDLRQAASDVEAARGNLIQARAYPNPTLGWNITPSNDGSVPGAPGPFIDQLIKTGGKLKLASASAEMDLKNAQLALRRARSDLSTRVRNAYYALLVAKETVRVNRGLAVMTDQIYRLHADLAAAGSFAAPYEPMALRGQAYTARLAHKQSIETYIYAWKALVSVVNLRQLPLSQVEGHIDRVIPYYDYDKVLDRVLRNHTDVLTARNGIDKAKYQLKLQQITPLPDIDVNVGVINDFVVPPKQFTPMATIGLPLFPMWDQNKGNIMAAEAAHIRAMEEPHRVEMNLTNLLATAYSGYKTNLEAVEYYRHHILPDQVRAYRGVLARRQVDPSVAFSDLFSSQQTLATSVSTYLGILGSLWSSVVSVADLLQTDDLFQLAEPRDLPRIPDLENLPTWPCCHPGMALDNPVPPSPTAQPAPGALSMGIDASSAAKNTMASFSPPSTNTPPTENYVPTPYPDRRRRFRPRHSSRTRKSGQEMLIHCVQARRQERLIHRKSVKGRPVPPKRFTMIAALKISALGVVTRKGAPKKVAGSDQSSQSKHAHSSGGRLVLAVICGLLVLEGRASAQQPGQSQPVSPLAAFAPSEAAPSVTMKPIAPSEPEVLPGFPQTPDQPASLYSAPSPAFTCDTSPGPYFDCDPRVDPPVLPQPGWFADVEVGVMLPHIDSGIHDAVTVNGVTSRVQLPAGTLDWAAVPRVELGYRLPEGFGEIALAYRFLGSRATGTASGQFAAPDAPGSLLTRLDIQVADLDYASNELSICNWWTKWRFGLRGADVYFDSQVDEPLAAAAAGSGVFERKATNNYWGIGPHGSLEIERRLTDWGLMAIGRLDGSILLGMINQGFFETSTTRGGGGQFLTGQTLEQNAGAVPEVEGNLGLGWRPQSCPALRVFAGYEYEHWWDIAKMPSTGGVADIYTQGVLLRVDFNY